jgi:hypothetical protein
MTILHGCHNRTLMPTVTVKDGFDSCGDQVWKPVGIASTRLIALTTNSVRDASTPKARNF